MTRLERIRRSMVREAVRENLEMIRGIRPGSRRRGGWRPAVLRGLRLAAMPSLLFLFLTGPTTGGGERFPSVPAREPTDAAAASLAFPAPRRINLAAFPLGVRRIVLDPGHGGADSGARTPTGLWEKEITLDVARRLRALLEEASLEVVMTRDADQTVSLRQRALIANTARGDLFVSIHINSLPEPDHRGVETYYLGPTGDPRVERIAGLENRESGYSLADFRRLLEGVYTHVRQGESRKLAHEVHRGLTTFLRLVNPAIKDDGVKTAPFLVLVASEMPGILAEVSCLSNTEEARLLEEPRYRQHIAQGLFAGIRAYAEARNRPQGS